MIVKRLDATEEEIFSELHHFLLRKNNRILSNEEVVNKTGVSSELIHKWVKTGKLKQSIFPNLGAPCEQCGNITSRPKLCLKCSTKIVDTLKQEEKDKEWFDKIHNRNRRRHTYHAK